MSFLVPVGVIVVVVVVMVMAELQCYGGPSLVSLNLATVCILLANNVK